MATTYYMSINTAEALQQDVDHRGTSSTAADNFEFRMGNGTYAPDQRACLLALERFRRELIQNALNGLGANLPPPTGQV